MWPTCRAVWKGTRYSFGPVTSPSSFAVCLLLRPHTCCREEFSLHPLVFPSHTPSLLVTCCRLFFFPRRTSRVAHTLDRKHSKCEFYSKIVRRGRRRRRRRRLNADWCERKYFENICRPDRGVCVREKERKRASQEAVQFLGWNRKREKSEKISEQVKE